MVGRRRSRSGILRSRDSVRVRDVPYLMSGRLYGRTALSGRLTRAAGSRPLPGFLRHLRGGARRRLRDGVRHGRGHYLLAKVRRAHGAARLLCSAHFRYRRLAERYGRTVDRARLLVVAAIPPEFPRRGFFRPVPIPLPRRPFNPAGDAPQVGPGAVGAALVDRVAGGAFLEHLLALGGVGGGEIDGDRLLGLGGALLALVADALDRIAHLLGPLVMEHLGGDDRGAERDDARAEHPARNRVGAIVHAFRDLQERARPRGDEGIASPFRRGGGAGQDGGILPAIAGEESRRRPNAVSKRVGDGEMAAGRGRARRGRRPAPPRRPARSTQIASSSSLRVERELRPTRPAPCRRSSAGRGTARAGWRRSGRRSTSIPASSRSSRATASSINSPGSTKPASAE